MRKHNSLLKTLKKQFLSINNSIESYFTKFKSFKAFLKKANFSTHNRVFLALGAVVILTLTYFLLPTLYNQNKIQAEIENQIFKKYQISIKFNHEMKYGLLPKPHFKTKNSSIIHDKKKIGNIENFKIFISADKLLNFDKVYIKDLVFKKTDFEIYKGDFVFFKNLLETEPNENKIIFKNSNIFFKDKDNEVLFINKIYNSKFYYDSKNLQNTFLAKNEIFNSPYKLTIKNDKFNKKIFMKFNSKKFRLDIENEIDYNDITKKGLLDVLFINKDTSLNYEIKSNSLSFFSENGKNKYEGIIDFKPFYFLSNFNYDGLSSKNLFNNDSIFINLIKSEILKNKNLNALVNLNIRDITNIDELNNLSLKSKIEEGEISFSDSNIMWKEDLNIKFNESLLNYDNNELNLIGKVSLEFKDLNNFYRSFQIKKNYRKKVNQIQIDFIYNLNNNEISFDNPRINNNSNLKVEKFIQDFNLQNRKIFNKITFKNFVNNFFEAYAG